MIRPATLADCPAIAALWAPVVRETLITFSTHVRTDAEVAQLIGEKALADMPFLVAETAQGLAGFATYGQFRAGPGYAHTMEHTILLSEWARGQGIGRALMTAIEAHAAARGVHSLWAGVSAANPAGVAFHERVGFRPIARLPEVGFKFGRKLDLILMQKTLPGGQAEG